MEQNNLNKAKTEEATPNKVTQPTHNMQDAIRPTHSQESNSGVIQSHTNYSTITNRSEQDKSSLSQSDPNQNQADSTNPNNATTLPIQIQLQKKIQIQQPLKPEPIKTQQVSIQVGGDKKIQMIKNTEETYAPQSCRIHTKQQIKTENLTTQQNTQRTGGPNDDIGGSQNKKTEVEIQVGVSLVDQPEKVISKAKQQRILGDHQSFLNYLQKHAKETKSQKTVYDDCYDQINKKRVDLYSLYNVLKQYFKYYASFTKQFYQKCQKVQKQQKVQQLNKYLNIGEQLKDGYDELVAFKAQTGNNYKKMHEYITTKTLNELDQIYNKYINGMNEALALTNQKRNVSLKLQQEFKKQGSKVQKMFNRIKQEKKQEQDFFTQLLKTIVIQRQFRQNIMQWGRQLTQTRKLFVDLSESCIISIQFMLNNFKNQSNTLYGIQTSKYQNIRKSRSQLEEQSQYARIITLTDTDYIRSSLQSSLNKQFPQITDKAFQKFIDMPHFQCFTNQSKELLQNMVVKTFNLKEPTQQLVNTVSGNLVLYNKQTSQFTQKIFIKHIKSALPKQDGIVEIEQKIPGIIFNSKKAAVIQFKDNDRAQELICFLGQGQTTAITNNS